MSIRLGKVFGFLASSVLVFAMQTNCVLAELVTQWNFNGLTNTTVPGGLTAPDPSSGIGTASLVGGVTAGTSFPSGTANGGSSDPVLTTPENYGWGTTTYPAISANNKTAGVRFSVSTVGWTGVTINWDTRGSNTSARHQQFQYSTDGTSFTDFGDLFVNLGGDVWNNGRTIDLTSIAGVNENPNFAFRLVSAFDPLGTGYVASNPASTYAGTGTLRFDMVTVNATAVPEPTSMALVGVAGALGLVARRRMKNAGR